MKYFEELNELIKNAYTPYYKFPTVAIAEMKDGTIFKGVNVENATQNVGSCAERVAMYSAIANGYKKGDFKAIYVLTEKDPSFPCMVCRGAFLEFLNGDEDIVAYSTNGKEKKVIARELSPFPFSNEDLVWK